MHLVYFDESGQSGSNLKDPAQPIFVLAATVVAETKWLPLEQALQELVDEYFPAPRPEKFEIHATGLRNGEGYFRGFSVDHRIAFRDACLRVAAAHEVRLIYRAITKLRFRNWVLETFGPGVAVNPHVAAFPLLARVIDEHLKSLPGAPLGIFISDENREIIGDVEKAIRLLRGIEGTLRLGQIVEKGFFIDSCTSLPLQLCDLCAYSARKKEEAKAGLPQVRPIDQGGIELIEPLIHRGNEANWDTLEWIVAEQRKKGAARG
jgi:hypothetical protein